MNRILIATILLCVYVNAKTFFIDPINGNNQNDGSDKKPWKSLQNVFDSGKIASFTHKVKPAVPGSDLVQKNQQGPVHGGDTLLLRSGFHGSLNVADYYNQETIYIMAKEGEFPQFESIYLRSVSKWVLDGFQVSLSFGQSYARKNLIDVESHGWTGANREITIRNMEIFSVPDVSNWTLDDWNQLPGNAIQLEGVKMIAEKNRIRNVNFGISSSGDSAIVSHNVIMNFAGDGMRGLGNYSLFEYNTVKNSYDVNENHDDGFQSWSLDENKKVGAGAVVGVVLRGNVILNYEDPNQPFRGPLQGIGCFDGMFKDWVIENNLIMVDHWHGISLYGVENVKVVNNTLVDLNSENPGPPWIRLTDHKNGTKPVNSLIVNNLTTGISGSDVGVTELNNVLIDSYEEHFEDYPNRNLHLKIGSSAIGSGDLDNAPKIDIEGNLRFDTRVDVGAYGFEIDQPTRKSHYIEQNLKRKREVRFQADGKVVERPMEVENYYPLYQ